MSFVIDPYRFRATPFTPADLSGLAVWFDPSDGATIWQDTSATTAASGTTAIKRIDDKSGNGRNATEATNNPTRSTINGLGALLFSTRKLSFTCPTSPTAVSIFVVLKADADPPASGFDGGLWTMQSADNGTLYPFTNGVIYDGAGSTARKTTVNPTPSLTSPRVYSVRSASGSWRNALDGDELYQTSTNTVGLPTTGVLGDSSASVVMKGRMGEFIMYTAAVSDTDHDRVVSYLKTKWGI